MKWTKKIAAIAVAATLAVSLAACGEAPNTNTSTPGTTTSQGANTADVSKMTPADLLAKSAQAQKDIKNVEAQADITMNMSSGDQTADMSIKMGMTMQENPMKAKIVMDMNVAGQSQKMDMYLIQDGDKGAIYLQSGGQWLKETLEGAAFKEQIDQYSQQVDTTDYTKDAEAFKNMGIKTVDGKEVVALEAEITGNEMMDLIKESGMDKQMEASLQGAGVSLDSIKTESGIKIVSYLDSKTFLPVKMEMDMTDFFSDLMTNLASSLGQSAGDFKVGKYAMDITFTNFGDDVKDITLPTEAANATETAGLTAALGQTA